MSAEEETQRIIAFYRDNMENHGTLAAGSKGLGKGAPYISDQLDDWRGLRIYEHLKSLAAVHHPLPQETLYRILFPLETCPAAVLAASREFQGLPRDPFLRWLAPRLEAQAAAGVVDKGASRRGGEAKRLDLLRRQDRELARKQLTEILEEELEAAGQRKWPRRRLGDLCMLLCVLAAIYRLAGRRDDATDLLVLTFRLVVLADNFAVAAEWFRKAAYLLVDLKNYKRADELIVEAHALFDLADLRAEATRCLVDRAYVLKHGGKFEASRNILHRVLPRLAKDDLEYRACAHQIMAGNLAALGDLHGARKQLDSAITVADDALTKSYCLLRRAEILIGCGDVSAGLDTYRQAMPLCAKHMGAAELAELGMKYASLLRQQGRRPELRALAADLSGWLEELRGHLRLQDAIADFQALIETDRLDDPNFERIVEEVGNAKNLPPAKSAKIKSLKP